MPNGDAALAASGIAVTVMMLAVLPALGVGQGVSVLVGQNLGDNQPQRAESLVYVGVHLALAYIAAVGSSFVLAPNFYLSWFHNAENAPLWGEVSTIVPFILMYVSLFTLFDCVNIVVSFALKGAGDTRFVTAVALCMPWPLMVLPTWLIYTHRYAIYLAWGAASVFIITQAVIFLIRFRSGAWKSMRVIH